MLSGRSQSSSSKWVRCELFDGLVLQTGSAWRFLPDKYPSPATCWLRLKQWEEQDVWLDAWRALLGAFDGEGVLQWQEMFLDGSFAPAKKGSSAGGKTKRGKGTKWMVLADGCGLPGEFGLKVPFRKKLRLRKPLAEVNVPRAKGRPRQKPKRMIADRAYDTDSLRERLAKMRYRVDLVLPRQQQAAEVPAWSEAASLRATVDR